MKLTTLTAMMLLTSATYAYAGGGAPVPEGSQKDDPSGRPGKILDDAECQKAWEMASPDGDTLSQDKATPYILNFEMVDSSKDAKISQEEWKDGCSKGWVSADAKTDSDMQGSPGGDDMSDSTGSDSDTVESAKMGEESGTHSGDEGNTSESDTQKIDQPARRNPTTENSTDTDMPE